MEVDYEAGTDVLKLEWRFAQVEGGVGVVLGTVRDVTERKRHEALQHQLETRAEEARHLEALGRLAGGVAHDFNNLLMVIMGYAELAQMDPTNKLNEKLSGIIDTTAHGATLTSQMLAFGRRQTAPVATTDFRKVTSDLQRLLDRLIETNVALHISLPDEPLWVRVGQSELEQVVINLVTNARDSLRSGGQIQVSLARADGDQTGHAEGAVLRVQDDGQGMDADTKRRIFEPFFTTKPMGRGTGLGLATVHGIVTRHHGEIQIESEVGEGTTFEVRLPCTQAPVASKAIEVGESPPLEPLSILLAEDEASLRQFIATVLRNNGHTVTLAEDGAQALARFDRADSHFDLVVTDLVMPKLGGRELAEALRSRVSDQPILFLSGYAPSTLAPGETLLNKPFDEELLRASVRRLWARSKQRVCPSSHPASER